MTAGAVPLGGPVAAGAVPPVGPVAAGAVPPGGPVAAGAVRPHGPVTAVAVTPRGLRRLTAGHLWVYRSDLAAPEAVYPAGLVAVHAASGAAYGWALHSPRSTIALRLLQVGGPEPDVPALLATRLHAARARRARLLPGADAVRLVHGEADFLPGMFVDQYGDALAVQLTCGGAEALRAPLLAALQAVCAPRAIVLRQQGAGRRHEGLAGGCVVAHGAAPVQAIYHEGTLARGVDLLAEQKTGAFLDQALNHVRAGRLARGRCLDCFTYHGGFALQMAARGLEVEAWDLSASALAVAAADAARAGLRVTWRQKDVLAALPELAASRPMLDTVVLDPPAFASTQRTLPAARRAYRALNAQALRALAPGGLLITCSCSGRLAEEEFAALVAAAARSVGRRLHAVARWGAGPDHPVLVDMPETAYLKCHVYEAL